MKLPLSELTIAQQLAEFDTWITPSLREIQDSEKYTSELKRIDKLISSLSEATNKFETVDSCTPIAIAKTCIKLIEKEVSTIDAINKKIECSTEIIESLCSLLFMVTGKSNNNLKCQFPVYLLQQIGRTSFPQRQAVRGKVTFEEKQLGRTISSDRLSKVIAEALAYFDYSEELNYLESEAIWLLGKYIASILKDESSATQFWALGKSYFNLLELKPGTEKSLLAPIVIFKVRGSVSASGGHIPEDTLRSMMDQWGMVRGIDYNTDDVIVGDIDSSEASKTRAYDFTIPYQTDGWEPHIFIQSQFYAGDSGSVSHKVVDQTKASRPRTLRKYPHARFIEYLDGAGYYASLNTDLQHMFGMDTTRTFIQIRSAHIKLRRELQDIGFLTPLEIEHSILRSSNCSINEVTQILLAEGYSELEVNRVLQHSIQRNLLALNDAKLTINPERLVFSRRILIIDLIALNGICMEDSVDLAGKIMIPGYGALYGIQLSLLSNKIDVFTNNAEYSRNQFASDITWLTEEKFVIFR